MFKRRTLKELVKIELGGKGAIKPQLILSNIIKASARFSGGKIRFI